MYASGPRQRRRLTLRLLRHPAEMGITSKAVKVDCRRAALTPQQGHEAKADLDAVRWFVLGLLFRMGLL